MPEYVRVRSDATGHEITVRERDVKPGLTVLDKPALGRDRLPLPPKYRVPLGSDPAPSAVTGTRPAPSPQDPVPTPDPESEEPGGHPLADTVKEND